MADLIGDETIYMKTYSKRLVGVIPEYTENIQKQGRKLMNADELRRKANKIAIIVIRGEHPVKDVKLNPKNHVNYKWLAEGKNLTREDNSVKIYEWEKAEIAEGSMVTDINIKGKKTIDIDNIDTGSVGQIFTEEDMLKKRYIMEV